jgi:hypothetical protein
MSDELPAWAEDSLREARRRMEALIERGQSGVEEWDDEDAFWHLRVHVPVEEIRPGGQVQRIQKPAEVWLTADHPVGRYRFRPGPEKGWSLMAGLSDVATTGVQLCTQLR